MKYTIFKSQVEYYDSGKYNACYPYIGRKCDIIAKYIQNLKDRKILDIGCYDGEMLKNLEVIGTQPIGVDISHISLLKAKQKKCLVVENDVSDGIAFADETFDIVYCSEIIEHILDTDFFLSEIYRILKPSGYIVITTPNICALRNRIRILFGGYPYNLEYKLGGAGHIHLYNVKVLTKQMEEHGFKQIKCVGVNLIPWKLCLQSRLLYRINSYLSSFFPNLCLNIVAIGRKL